jgi:predicted DNA binding CopG/RHH family protein
MATKKLDPYDVKLNAEEQDLLESFERGEWKTVDNLEEEMAFVKEAAANFLLQDAEITLRISSEDLDQLKRKAAYKGLPFQAFIASVLHEYAAGHFVEVA